MTWKDKDDPKNSSEYHTGKTCIEVGCENPAGTAWSPLWCFECNVKRITGIDRRMKEIKWALYGRGHDKD